MRAARPRVRHRGAACVLTILGAIAVCAPADAKGKLDAPPRELLVTVAIGPVTTFRNLQAYAEAIKPGAGAALSDQVVRRELAEAVGATSLDGFDPVSWMYLLVADNSGSTEVALLGKVANAKALVAGAGPDRLLSRGGWAVIGSKPLLDRIGPYALSAIAPQPAPRALSATVYLPQVLARYHTQIEAIRTQVAANLPGGNASAMGKMMASYADGLASLASDTGGLVATLEATPDTASLDLALTPLPKSRLATFAAVQRPTDFGLLARLPATSPSVLVAGHFELGPYHAGILAAMTAMYIPEVSEDLRVALDVLSKSMTGEVAMAMQFGLTTGLSFTQLYGVADTRATDKALARILEQFKTGRTIDLSNMSTTITASAATAAHDGVVLRSYDTSYDVSKIPPAQRQSMARFVPAGVQRVHIAAFDGLGMFVAGADSLAEAERAIDAARGKGPHYMGSAMIDPLIAASRERKDSIALVMDLGRLLAVFTGASMGPQPAILSFGVAGRNVHFRIALPAATLRAVSAAKP